MANSNNLSLLSGLLQGYQTAKQNKKDRESQEELKKLQVKMFKKGLEDKEKEEAAFGQIANLMQGLRPPAGSDIGPPESVPKKPLLDILADPQGQALAMQSGKFSPQEILRAGKPSGFDLSKLPPGMVLSGVKITPDGEPMYDFSLPKADKEVKDPTGRNVVSLDQYGNPISSRPVSPEELSLTPAQKAIDAKFAEEYTQFQTAGGYADVKKGISQLNEAVKALNSGKNLTGPVMGSTPAFALQFANPEAISVKDAVEEVVQRNLKLVLGAQFTEKEGEKLIARAYNPNLDEAENAKRVRRLISQIQGAANAKMEAISYYEKNGTLAGWKGKLYDISDFENALSDGSSKKVIKFSDLPAQ